jgi:Helix-turn-helix domain
VDVERAAKLYADGMSLRAVATHIGVAPDTVFRQLRQAGVGHHRIERPMDRDQVVRADELVELDIVHVAALADLRCVKNREDVIGLDVNLGHVIALGAVPHCDRVEAEHSRQHIDRLPVTDRDVHPDNGVLTFEQPRELLNLMSFDTCIADKQDIHTLATFDVTSWRIRGRGRRG